MSDYESLLQAAYERFLRPGDHVIDVGAHLGRHTFPLAKAVSPNGKVYAFEPLEMCRNQLRENLIGDSDLERIIEIHPDALANYSGRSQFVVALHAPGYSGLRRRVYDVPTETRTVEVTVRRLDDLFWEDSQLRYIKVDAEGGEYHVLLGAVAILQKLRPVVSFEFGLNSLREYGVTPEDMAALLRQVEYVVFDIEGLRLDRQSFCQSAVDQRLWDYIAMPAELAGQLDFRSNLTS